MAQYRSSSELLDNILERAGEVTNGNSSYESEARSFLNKVHRAVINGATIFNMRVDEYFPWAQARHPIILELQPKYDTGTISVANGSVAFTFSSAPTPSFQNRFIKMDGDNEWYRIGSHAAGATSGKLDAKYVGDTGSSKAFKVVQLEYDLVPSYIIIDSENDKLDFEETDGTELTATLTHGVYTPSELATEVQTQLNAAGGDTYTVSYSSSTRKFTITTDDGSTGFSINGGSGSNGHRSAWGTLGFDDKDYAFITSSGSAVSDYELSRISRLANPFEIYKSNAYGESALKIYKLTHDEMLKQFPMRHLQERVPAHYSVVRQHRGRMWVRFNSYPSEAMRVVIPYIPLPRDLQDSVNSIPLIPPTSEDILEYGAAHYILQLKNDDKAAGYASVAGAEIETLVQNNHSALDSGGIDYGRIIPRPDHMPFERRELYIGGKDC